MKGNYARIICVLCLCGTAGLYAADETTVVDEPIQYAEPTPRPPDIRNVRIAKVVDSQTLELTDGRRVRLIGVRAPGPSTGIQANQSYQMLKRLVENRDVDIELDTQRFDDQGRMLAYVHLPDGTFVNAELLRQGYAEPITEPSTLAQYNATYKVFFNRLSKDAKRYNRGLWQ